MSCTDSSFSATSDAGDDSQSLVSGIESNGGAPIEELINLSIDDDESIDLKSETSGAYSFGSTKSNKRSSSSNEPYRPPFVIKGSQADSDDVFRSSPRRSDSSNQRTPTAPKASRGLMNSSWRSRSSSEGSVGDATSPSREKVQRDAKRNNRTPGSSGPQVRVYASSSPRSNLAGYEVITDDDAQAKFPPSCCVFVANLLQSETEEALQAAVTKVFSEYGIVFVKIRRDPKQMPFAFCQYTDVKHAERAIREGRGRLINGRPCRTEKAKAHRELDSIFNEPVLIAEVSRGLFFVERKYGPVVTPEEVRKMMYHFGTITQCYTASGVERAALNLNEGVIIEFEMYDEGQAAFAAFRGHDVFKVTAVNSMATPPRSDSSHRAYLDRYHADRSSIFVGALPADITEPQLRQLFEPYGPIVDVAIRVTPSRYDPEENICFAFVEYRSWESVPRVMAAKNTITLNGKPLRISQKGIMTRRNPVQNESPARRREPVSPIAASPIAAQSPPQYGFYGYSPMNYPSTATLYTDGQGQYYTAYASPHTSPSYYSPSYATPSPAQQAYWPQAQPYYWGGYPAPSYGAYTPSSQQQQVSPPPSSYAPSYIGATAPTVSDVDRSVTPTPSGHESSLES